MNASVDALHRPAALRRVDLDDKYTALEGQIDGATRLIPR